MKLVTVKNNINIIYYPILTMKFTTLKGLKLKKEDETRKTGNEIKQEIKKAIIKLFNNIQFTNITDDVTDAISAVVAYVRLKDEIIDKQSAN